MAESPHLRVHGAAADLTEREVASHHQRPPNSAAGAEGFANSLITRRSGAFAQSRSPSATLVAIKHALRGQ
jgi:hypothetical protein